MLPIFLICGAQKSGTTSLMEYLDSHPDIYIPSDTLYKPGAREVHYFDENYTEDVDWYTWHFKEAGKRMPGEKSPGYMYYPECPRRIHDVIPDAKLIFVLRDPVDRAYSAYWMHRRNGTIHDPFIEAAFDRNDLLDRGYYDVQLQRYLNLFNREQMRVYTLKSLRENPDNVYRDCCQFIGVDDTFIPDTLGDRHNEGGIYRSEFLAKVRSKVKQYRLMRIARLINLVNVRRGAYPPLPPEHRRTLILHYRPHNKRLHEQFPHLDIAHWEEL